MKKGVVMRVMCLIFIFCFLAAAYGQKEVGGITVKTAKVGEEKREKDRAEIRVHIKSIFQAYVDKDAGKIRATHSKDWHGYLTKSRTLIRGIDKYMDGVEPYLKSDDAMISFTLTDVDIMFRGDIALAFVIADVEYRAGKETIKDKLRIVDGYEKQSGKWQQIASNVSRHPDAVSNLMASATSLTPQLRKFILDGREAVWKAWFSYDKATLEKLVPKDAIVMDAGEEGWKNHAEILKGSKKFKESGARLVRLEFPQTDIQVYGQTVILYTKYLFEVEADGKRTTSSGRGTEIFVIRDGLLVNTGWHLDSAVIG